ncbi:MAG: transposase, partial [Candidatus Rokuibacteriota bacterium]
LDGFDLHANGAVRGEDRKGLEQLCRYLLRPAVAQDRLQLTGEGRVVLELKAAWGDGTTHLVFEPLDFLARLAALTPRPRINLVVYHGVLAPHARWRAAVVRYGVAASAEGGPITEAVSPGADTPAGGGLPSGSTDRGWRT